MPREHHLTATHARLSQHAKVWVGLPVSRYIADAPTDAGEVVLSIGDIESNLLKARSTSPKLTLRGDIERFRVRRGSLLISARSTVLKFALVPEAYAGSIASSNLIVVVPQPELDAAYLAGLLGVPSMQAQLTRRSRSSAGLIQLTARDVEQLRIPVPPLAAQHVLGEFVAANDAYRQATESALGARRELQLAVFGLIVDQAEADEERTGAL